MWLAGVLFSVATASQAVELPFAPPISFDSPGTLTINGGRGFGTFRISDVFASKRGAWVVTETFEDDVRTQVGLFSTKGGGTHLCKPDCAAAVTRLQQVNGTRWHVEGAHKRFDASRIMTGRPADRRSVGTQVVEVPVGNDKVVVRLARTQLKRMNQYGTRSLLAKTTIEGFGHTAGVGSEWTTGAWVERVLVTGRDVIVIVASENFGPEDETERFKIYRATLAGEGGPPFVERSFLWGVSDDRKSVEVARVIAEHRAPRVRAVKAVVTRRSLATGRVLSTTERKLDRKWSSDIPRAAPSGSGSSHSSGTMRLALTAGPACPPERPVSIKLGPTARLFPDCARGLWPLDARTDEEMSLALVLDDEGKERLVVGRDPNFKPRVDITPHLPEVIARVNGVPLKREHISAGKYGDLNVEARLSDMMFALAVRGGHARKEEAARWMARLPEGHAKADWLLRALAIHRWAVASGWLEPAVVDEQARQELLGKNHVVEVSYRKIHVPTRIFGEEQARAHAEHITAVAQAGGDLEALGEKFGYGHYGELQTKRVNANADDELNAAPGTVIGPRKDRSSIEVIRVEGTRELSRWTEDQADAVLRIEAMTPWSIRRTLQEQGVIQTRFTREAAPWPADLAPPLGGGRVEYRASPALVIDGSGQIRSYEGEPPDADRIKTELDADTLSVRRLNVFADARAPAASLEAALRVGAQARAAVFLLLADRTGVALAKAKGSTHVLEVDVDALRFGRPGELKPLRRFGLRTVQSTLTGDRSRSEPLGRLPFGATESSVRVGLRLGAGTTVQDVVDALTVMEDFDAGLMTEPP